MNIVKANSKIVILNESDEKYFKQFSEIPTLPSRKEFKESNLGSEYIILRVINNPKPEDEFGYYYENSGQHFSMPKREYYLNNWIKKPIPTPDPVDPIEEEIGNALNSGIPIVTSKGVISLDANENAIFNFTSLIVLSMLASKKDLIDSSSEVTMVDVSGNPHDFTVEEMESILLEYGLKYNNARSAAVKNKRK